MPKEAFIVPNFHPASCGWLTNFSSECVYCANCYLDHLGRVRDDPTYKFVLSEVNNLIAIMNFQPARIEEIKPILKRDELVPKSKLAALHQYGSQKGHPPRGDQAPIL